MQTRFTPSYDFICYTPYCSRSGNIFKSQTARHQDFPRWLEMACPSQHSFYLKQSTSSTLNLRLQLYSRHHNLHHTCALKLASPSISIACFIGYGQKRPNLSHLLQGFFVCFCFVGFLCYLCPFLFMSAVNHLSCTKKLPCLKLHTKRQ